MTELPPLPEAPLGLYRHHKGGLYEVVGVSRHSESLEPMVVYQPLQGEGGLWVRPFAMFFESVVHEGKPQPRFAAIGPASAAPVATPKPARVGVGVGVGVLVVHQGLVLLGRRKGSHGAGTWSAPGGKLEMGEDLEACARRELAEETGLEASVTELGPYTNDVFDEANVHHLTVFVVARGIRGAPRNLEPERCEGWAWFAWDALPAPLFKPLQNLLAIGWRPGGV